MNVTYFDGLGCVRYFNVTKNWHQARITCQSISGDLAIIDPTNECDELDAYHQTLRKYNYMCLYSLAVKGYILH